MCGDGDVRPAGMDVNGGRCMGPLEVLDALCDVTHTRRLGFGVLMAEPLAASMCTQCLHLLSIHDVKKSRRV